jgi:hypothetical protein
VLSGVGKHEVRLTRGQVGLYGIEVMLVLFDFDSDCCNVVIKLLVVCDLSHKALVVSVGHGLL